MKKKFIFSVAATAAILAGNPATQTDAATIYPTGERKIIYYQSGTLDNEQINKLINKYIGHSLELLKQGSDSEPKAPTKAAEPTKAPAPAKAAEPTKAPAPAKAAEPTKAPAPAKAAEPTKAPAPAQKAPAQAPTSEQKPAAASEVSAYEQKVVELTNQERAKNGLQPLVLDKELSKVAREKSRDMQANNYFSHTSPTYGSPFDMMKKFGVTYRTAGENIAMGQRTPEEVVQAWMNSEGHRKNIMSANYTHIGVGHIEQGNYWTQMFIGK